MTGKQKIGKLFDLAERYQVSIDHLPDDAWNELDNLAFAAYCDDGKWEAVEAFFKERGKSYATI